MPDTVKLPKTATDAGLRMIAGSILLMLSVMLSSSTGVAPSRADAAEMEEPPTSSCKARAASVPRAARESFTVIAGHLRRSNPVLHVLPLDCSLHSLRRRLLLAAAWHHPFSPLLGLILFGQGAYIHAKALLAQVLLQRAFDETIATGHPTKPWSWADTWPVARIEVKRIGASAIVLAGSSGQALAFGPGHVN